jgi:hypothetical protein
MAECRTTLSTWGARPIRIHEAALRSITSRTQNARFSIAHRLRHIRSRLAASVRYSIELLLDAVPALNDRIRSLLSQHQIADLAVTC